MKKKYSFYNNRLSLIDVDIFRSIEHYFFFLFIEKSFVRSFFFCQNVFHHIKYFLLFISNILVWRVSFNSILKIGREILCVKKVYRIWFGIISDGLKVIFSQSWYLIWIFLNFELKLNVNIYGRQKWAKLGMFVVVFWSIGRL